MCPFLLRIFLDVNRLKKVLDKFNLLCYNLVTRLKETTKVKGSNKMIRRIKAYFWCKRMGINHPWKASGDSGFIQFG